MIKLFIPLTPSNAAPLLQRHTSCAPLDNTFKVSQPLRTVTVTAPVGTVTIQSNDLAAAAAISSSVRREEAGR